MPEPLVLTGKSPGELALMAFTAVTAAGFAALTEEQLRQFPGRQTDIFKKVSTNALEAVLRFAMILGVCEEDLDSATVQTVVQLTESAKPPGKGVSA
ncbi:hypothetical protein [Nocardia altamirensis]|uniref:hypothetical protein n=1 Tax=Nocardia altamirensis TaxID=472158 RepID=UPI0008406CBD|nr:hypothetical protein [Nocardia altamirensis]